MPAHARPAALETRRGPDGVRHHERGLEVLTFGAGNERFAIDTELVRRVLPWDRPTTLATRDGAMAWVGPESEEAFPVFDPAVLLGSGVATRRADRVLALGSGRIELGLLTQGEPVWSREHEILDLPWHLPAGDRALFLGVTATGVLMLNGGALLDDRRFFGDGDGTAREEGRVASA